MTVGRQAEIRYPNNSRYANVPSGTKGGYTALITGPGGSKLPSGTITLTFSEPVSAGSIALMYEPAIYIQLLIERGHAYPAPDGSGDVYFDVREQAKKGFDEAGIEFPYEQMDVRVIDKRDRENR